MQIQGQSKVIPNAPHVQCEISFFVINHLLFEWFFLDALMGGALKFVLISCKTASYKMYLDFFLWFNPVGFE